MKRELPKRLLSLLLAVVLCVGLAVPAGAVEPKTSKISFEQVENETVSVKPSTMEAFEEPEEEPIYSDTDEVRVSIVLSEKSTLETTVEKGFSTENIAANAAAMGYRRRLETRQNEMAKEISAKALNGKKLDVVWNLTLAANIISATVEFGQIEAIEAMPGVEAVLIETRYEPAVLDSQLANDPNMSTSTVQTGSSAAWAVGYTGAGSRIAIIDTGVDPEHQSFAGSGLDYSLEQQAALAGMDKDAYLASLDLLDEAEIAGVLDQLNVNASAADLYRSSKIAFGYNYVDRDLDISHLNDTQEEHGGHVAGIAAANAYVPNGDGTFSNALEKVLAQGVAPDAQLMVMKVFGKRGGAYDSDYMIAIEDAIVLGADSINLSLGSGNPGASHNATAQYQAILDNLVHCGTVVAMSAGNAGGWAENAAPIGYLYDDGVSMQTNGTPGSFTNSLCVASVNNAGHTGDYLLVGDYPVFYTQTTGYTNKPMTTVAGEQEYILIDGFGTPEEFAAIPELAGKIAVCSRGEISFYEKGDNAAEAGAIASIIYNNQAGSINMDLSDYTHEQPCVSVTQAEGDLLKANAEPVTDESGNVLYYKGKLTVKDSLGSAVMDRAYETMSDFSSWGVPGSLQLKPEVTAPGGNIYSVNGYHKAEAGGMAGGHDAYENMSGTSMASPQVAGMAALAAQYIRENGLEAQTGLDARTLAQSLLMSTAVPMLEEQEGGEGYYSVLRQGAGLANIGNVVTADSYILMDETATVSAADGKVKAELGDDPEKNGVYTISFSVNNLTDEKKSYDLAADLFTQDLFAYYVNEANDVGNFMDTWTTPLSAAAEWTVDGQVVVPQDSKQTDLDFNGDGKVNALDADALMEYVVGKLDTVSNLDKADLDDNGEVNSYDVYLFLNSYNAGAMTVPANGSVDVTVTLTLTEAQKAYLDANYPTGAYVEGYVFVTSASDDEGVAGTEHSIPVLGYYGNWSDPSMYDVGSYVEFMSGEEVRTPYLSNPKANSFAVTYANDPSSAYYFGGNPLVADDTYMPERNAINSENGDMIGKISFTAVRNAAAGRILAVNETTDEVLMDKLTGAVDSAFYYTNGQQWRNTNWSLKPNFVPKAAEGDQLSLSLTLAPEYYVDAEGNVDWDALGEGSDFSMSMVVDNTIPVIEDITLGLMDNTLRVKAHDNQYVSAVVLYNKSGTVVYSYDGAKQDIQPGETGEYALSLEGVSGKKFLLQVCDYAMNTATYELNLDIGGGEEAPLPEMIAFDLDENYWTSFTKESTDKDIAMYAPSGLTFFAATIVDHIVFASTEEGALYVMPEDDLTDLTKVCDLGVTLTDMAYNKADGKIYAVASGYLVTVDKLTGELDIVDEIGVQTNTLACDANGTFYCNKYGTGEVYSFTLDTIAAPKLLKKVSTRQMQYVQTMEVNPNNGMLCWNSYYVFAYGSSVFGMSYYYEIDPATGAYTQYNDLYDEMSCLIIPETTSGGSWAAPTDQVSGLVLSNDTVAILRGNKEQLSASVLPWTATDRTVTWATSDASVATVDETGLVTGVGTGTCTVTATSNLNPSFTADCEVTVSSLDITLKGVLQDEKGTPQFFDWDMAADQTWTGGTEMDTSLISATMDTENGCLYVMDGDSTNAMHKVDPATGKSDEIGANAAGVPLWDMEYSSVFSTADAAKVNSIYYYYFLAPKDPMNLNTSAFNLSSTLSGAGASYLVAITSMGYEKIENGGKVYDTERVLLLDNTGNIWNFWIYATEGGGFSALLNDYSTNLKEAFPGDEDQNMLSSMVVGEDGLLYLSAFDGQTNNLYRIELDDENGTGLATRIGDVGQDVWPAALYAVESNVEANDSDAVRTVRNAEKVTAKTVSPAELAMAKLQNTMTHAATVDNSQKTGSEEKTVTSMDTMTMDTFAPFVGGLHSVVANSGAPVRPDSGAVTADHEIVLDVTAKNAEGVDIDSTNGKLTVSYDSSVFELRSVEGHAQVFAYNDAETGSVVLGYAGTEAIAVGESVATLTFVRKADKAGAMAVEHQEANDAKPAYNEEIAIAYTPVKQETIVVRAVYDGDKAGAKVVWQGKAPKGTNLVEFLNENAKIAVPEGYVMDQWYNWDWYGHKHNDKATVNGWTNVYVTFTAVKMENVVVKAVVDGDKANAKIVWQGKAPKGANLVDFLNENVKIEVPEGYVMDQWYNWDWYGHKHNENATVNGWTNVYVTFTQVPMVNVVVKAVFDGDKSTAKTIWSGKAPKGANLVEWLTANVPVPEEAGYTADTWYNWDWYGHKHNDKVTFNGWTNVYVNYISN